MLLLKIRWGYRDRNIIQEVWLKNRHAKKHKKTQKTEQTKKKQNDGRRRVFTDRLYSDGGVKQTKLEKQNTDNVFSWIITR